MGHILRRSAFRGSAVRRISATRRTSSTASAGESNTQPFELLSRYHAGDWRGVWTTVTVGDGDAPPPRKMRTHLELVDEGTAIHHVSTNECANGRHSDLFQC